MFMFGAMYAPTDNLTLMAMSSFNQKEMISQNENDGWVKI